jgi:hypothetical protein
MKLAICTPSPNKVSIQHKYTFADVMLLCAERDVQVIPMDDTTPGNLPQSRNLLMYRVCSELDDDDWAWWLDSDVSCDGRLLIDILHREEDVIVRGYPRRAAKYGDPPLWSVDLQRRGLAITWNEERNMLRVASSGFGWVLMRARVAKKLAEKYGVRGVGGRGNKTIPAFDHLLDETGTECGEDVSCWRRLADIGVEGWCTPTGLLHNGELSGVYYHALQQAGMV